MLPGQQHLENFVQGGSFEHPCNFASSQCKTRGVQAKYAVVTRRSAAPTNLRPHFSRKLASLRLKGLLFIVSAASIL